MNSKLYVHSAGKAPALGRNQLGASLPSASWIEITLVMLAFMMIIYVGMQHTTEIYFSAEQDLYAENAQMILRGIWPRDVYHPMGYPLLAAVIGKATGDTFLAGKLISQMSAACVVLLTWHIGRRFFTGRTPVVFALSAMALNYHFLTEGVAASSDMMFSALALATLYCATLAVRDKANFVFVLLTGVLTGMAYFTRYIGITLVPVCLSMIVGWPGRGWGANSAWRGLLFCAAVLVSLLPHMSISMEVFGRPFYDENYRSLAMKLYGWGDWSYLAKVPFDNYAEVIKSWPGGVVRGAWNSFSGFISHGMRWMLIPFCDLRFPGLLALLLWSSIAYAMWRGGTYIRTCLGFFAFYTLVICVTFGPLARYYVFFIPIGFLCVGNVVERLARHFFSPGAAYVVVGASTLALLAAFSLAFAQWMPEYVDSHYEGELTELIRLDRELPVNSRVAGTNPFAGRHVRFHYDYIPEAAGAGKRDILIYYEALNGFLKEKNSEYLFIGSTTLGLRPMSLLYSRSVPAFLSPMTNSAGTAFYRVKPMGRNEPTSH